MPNLIFNYPYLLYIVFLIIPSAYVMFSYTDQIGMIVFLAIMISFVVFITTSTFFYFLLKKRHPKKMTSNQSLDFVMVFLFTLFITSYVVLSIDYGGVPVIKYLFSGGIPNSLRAEFYKGKDGYIEIFVYIRSILMKGFIPLFSVYAYVFYSKKKFIFVALIYIFLSLITFEKSAIIWFFLPMLFFFIFQKRYKMIFFIMVLIIFCLGILGSLQQSEHNANTYEKDKIEGFREDFRDNENFLHQIENYQFLFTDLNNKRTVPFLLDRLFWIPYITVYDTFYYWTENYTDSIGVSINRHLAKVFDKSFADIERSVFIFQYGGGEHTTGNSNSSYIAEAYIGFGWMGVVLFSASFGLIIAVINSTKNPILISALSVYPYAVITSASLLSMMFSGGLLLFLFLAFLLSIKIRL